jgi:hypothetical protein
LNIILPRIAQLLHLVSSLQFFFFWRKWCIHFSSPHACYTLRPSHPFWFHHFSNILWRVKITKTENFMGDNEHLTN